MLQPSRPPVPPLAGLLLASDRAPSPASAQLSEVLLHACFCSCTTRLGQRKCGSVPFPVVSWPAISQARGLQYSMYPWREQYVSWPSTTRCRSYLLPTRQAGRRAIHGAEASCSMGCEAPCETRIAAPAGAFGLNMVLMILCCQAYPHGAATNTLAFWQASAARFLSGGPCSTPAGATSRGLVVAADFNPIIVSESVQ